MRLAADLAGEEQRLLVCIPGCIKFTQRGEEQAEVSEHTTLAFPVSNLLASEPGLLIVGPSRLQVTLLIGDEAKVAKQNAPDAPWPIEKIELEWTVRGRGLKEKAVRDAVRLAEEKYCSVSASMTSELVTTVRVLNEDEGEA